MKRILVTLLELLMLVVAGTFAAGTFAGIGYEAYNLYRAAWWAPAVMLIVPSIALAYYLRANGSELLYDFKFWWRYERPGHRYSYGDIPTIG
jgi:hypothetical protein